MRDHNIFQVQPEALTDDLCGQIVRCFERNYPDQHSAEQRTHDLEKRGSKDQLQQLLNEALLYVATDVKKQVIGVLEIRSQELPDGIYVILVWMLVNEALRGQGLGSAFHELFERHATGVKERSGKPTAQLLSVHADNPAKAKYERWGYQIDDRGHPDEKMVFMYKDVTREPL